MLLPASLALLNHACHGDERARAHAIGLWTAAGSVSLALGPVLGGLLVHWLGWRSIFLVNLPIGMIGIGLGSLFVEETAGRDGAFDPAGQILGVTMLAAVTAAVIEAGSFGWQSGVVMGCGGLALAALAGFIVVETRAHDPMLPLGMFRLPNVAASVVVGFAVNFAIYGTIFVFNLFLQQKAGYSAMASGLAFLPFPVVLFGANVLAGRLAARFGPKRPMIAGMVIGMAGFAALSLVGPGTAWFAMVPGLVLISAGIGTTVPAMTAALLGAVPKPRAGLASGILNTVRQSGGAIGVAFAGSLFAHDGVAGFHAGLFACIPVLVVAALVAMLGLRAPR
jgi:DHA2 family methylenomycin A resistance protein-like MFS transporter